MKKLTITISEEAHTELLKIQLDRRLKEKKKYSLAVIAADVIHQCIVEEKKTT